MRHETTCELYCTDTGRVAIAEVDRFQDNVYLQCFIGGMSVNMQYHSKQKKYIGSAAGLEFMSDGPRVY